MKRLLVLTLTVILFTSMILVSCGEPEPEPTSTQPTQTQPTQTQPTQTQPTQTQPTQTQPTATTPKPVETEAPEPEEGLGDLAKPEGGKEGGWLIIPTGSDIANIGSTNEISNPTDAGYSFVCTEGLLRTDPEGNLKPMLAKSWDVAEDGTYIDFYLREGIKFHDGVDFNAEAVKVNIDMQINSPVWTNLYPLDRTEILDDYTIRIYFDETFDWGAVTSLATFFSCRMFSPDFLLNETDEYKRSHVVGTGPFILDEYERGQYIKYVRNDDYWRGTPYLEGIEYRILPQAETQLLAFKTGEIHVLPMIQAMDAADLIAEGYDVQETYAFVFNGGIMGSAANPDSPWADIRVRRAAAHAIDQELLVESLYYGYGRPSNQVFIEGTAWYNPDTVGYEYDPDKARQLLADAGYANGFDTTWILIDYMSLDLPTAVQDMLREVGINAEFELVSMPIYNSLVATGWEGFVWGGVFAGTSFEPSSCLVNGVLNGKTTWISCIQPDELYEKGLLAGRELDPVKRAQMYQEISKSLTDDYCQIAYLPYSAGLSSYSPILKGYVLGYSDFQYTFAWLDE